MSTQKQPSPESYVRTRARKLSLGPCYVNDNWQEMGMANVIVTRKHTNGNFTVGVYLVDCLALGVKDSFFKFNVEEAELEEIINRSSGNQLVETDYVTAHNIVYGANAFAEEHGFKPCKEFKNNTQYILEDDENEDIEIIEFEFGRDGKPLLIL